MPPATRSGSPLRHWPRRAAKVLAGLALALLVGLLAWARVVAPAERSARLALDSDDSVIVARGEWVSFRPRDVEPTTGVIFYPGGKADPAAYAPVLRRLALDGYFVVLTPMPLNLAVLAPGTAGRVIARHPEVRRWVLGGHSLGGVVAAAFAARHPSRIAGLLLWAAYPAASTDLARAPWPVLMIAGSADTLATPAKMAAARRRLPPGARHVEIRGGDHWGFAHFDPALSTATISRDQQQAEVLAATEALLAEIDRAADAP